MRPFSFGRILYAAAAFFSFAFAGCGHHTLGAATHLPPDVRTLSVPVFATHTEANGTETVMTGAVIREFAARTGFKVTPANDPGADAVLHGTILKQVVTPLTYNSNTQQSSSFVVTIVVAVTINARDGRVLYKNDNYTYREQYQSTVDLPTFFQEDPAAVQRLSRNFARQLVADVLEGY